MSEQRPPTDPTGPDGLPLPDELRRALAASPAARTAFDGLPPSHRREYVRWVREARRDDTRERRAAQTVMRLLEPAPAPGNDAATGA